MPTAVSISSERERDAVVSWRCSQLRLAGVSKRLAARLARDDRYDLHRLIQLLEDGCPLELALRILAPLEGDEVA